MISETGSKSPHRTGGFTLIEIVLVLGLIAVAASIVIANFTSMAERGNELTVEQTLRAAVREARFLAARERIPATLRYNPENGSLEIALEQGPESSYELGGDFGKDGGGQIRFFLIPPAEGLSPFQPPDRSQLQTQTVRFAPDRCSSPFVVEIDHGSSTPERLVFDPFSSLLTHSDSR